LLSGLYTILMQNDEEILIELASKSHPIFKAHFPTHPLLPGFTIIDIVAEILNHKIIYIKQSKFIGQLLPNDKLLCRFKHNENQTTVTIFKNEKEMSKIIYESK